MSRTLVKLFPVMMAASRSLSAACEALSTSACSVTKSITVRLGEALRVVDSRTLSLESFLPP